MKLITSNSRVLQSSGRFVLTRDEIIKDASLAYWFDPSRTTSYPGSGISMYDISGKGYTATLYNDIAFTGNSFRCEKYQQIIAPGITFPGSGTFGSTYDITITLWFKGNSSTRYQYPLSISGGDGHFEFDLNDTDGGGGIYRTIWIYWNSGGSPLSALPIGALGGGGPDSDLLNNAWQCYTFRRNVSESPYTEHFVNGVKIIDEHVNRLGPQTDDVFYGGNLHIGAVSSFSGEVGSSHAYTRALSDSEIAQNYNTEKNRFI